jgi:hypothetical protein
MEGDGLVRSNEVDGVVDGCLSSGCRLKQHNYPIMGVGIV